MQLITKFVVTLTSFSLTTIILNGVNQTVVASQVDPTLVVNKMIGKINLPKPEIVEPTEVNDLTSIIPKNIFEESEERRKTELKKVEVQLAISAEAMKVQAEADEQARQLQAELEAKKPPNTPAEWNEILASPLMCSAGSAQVLASYRDQLPAKLPTNETRLEPWSGNAYASGQCTWYVYNRMNQLGLACYPRLGNGGEWAATGPFHNQQVDVNPHDNWAVCFLPGSNGTSVYGHVGFVEKVNGDGTFLISEMNYNGGLYQIHWRVLTPNPSLKFVAPQMF